LEDRPARAFLQECLVTTVAVMPGWCPSRTLPEWRYWHRDGVGLRHQHPSFAALCGVSPIEASSGKPAGAASTAAATAAPTLLSIASR
jgi:hypothetical protein